MADHFYTTDPKGEAAPQAGYKKEGIACHVRLTGGGSTIPLYRWFHPKTGDHFYTTDPKGELAPKAGYRSEGIACYVWPPGTYGTDVAFGAFYRWYHPGNNDHFYTTDKTGELAPKAGYKSEGVACWVAVSLGVNEHPDLVPLFRWYQE